MIWLLSRDPRQELKRNTRQDRPGGANRAVPQLAVLQDLVGVEDDEAALGVSVRERVPVEHVVDGPENVDEEAKRQEHVVEVLETESDVKRDLDAVKDADDRTAHIPPLPHLRAGKEIVPPTYELAVLVTSQELF